MAQNRTLTPQSPVVFVSENEIKNIPPAQVKIKYLGEKAFGLSCLPSRWVPQFFVVSPSLFDQIKSSADIDGVLEKWLPAISECAKNCGFPEAASIYIRSSSTQEGMAERGKYHSSVGRIENLNKSLKSYFQQVLNDDETSTAELALIIQRNVTCSHKGHLSNERRCYKEARDWMGQFEDEGSSIFSVNLRNWREVINVEDVVNKYLDCNLKLNISDVLRAPAAWGSQLDERIHFEWVWDGHRIFLVQVEREIKFVGFNPENQNRESSGVVAEKFTPKVLEKITITHGEKYSKIRNVMIYMKLGLPTVPLYILDNPNDLKRISEGHFGRDLVNDLNVLVRRSLVVRMDIESEDKELKQMLPRTQEIRQIKDVKNWLQENVKKLLSENPSANIALIFHNFIPSVSSAFSSAIPNERKVEIESLWGIPEGLYYYSHDKFIVDTLSAQKIREDISKYSISQNINYKPFCVAPDDNGDWDTRKLSSPHDWKPSISSENWIKEIARATRMIAEHEGKSVSVMWFIDLLIKGENPVNILPWFHEEIERVQADNVRFNRKKTPFDKSIEISTSDDINRLERAAEQDIQKIRQILVRPREEKLLRDKDTLKRVGDIAKKCDAAILLEGATLSHAFYQLMQTGAAVIVVNAFKRDEGKREFNKLVRDNVPSNIIAGGESVNATKLVGEALIKALREKLVEESIEVLDANDRESLLDEVADVMEVVDSLLSQVNSDLDDVNKRRLKKKEKAGGFEEGYVLLETANPSPSTNVVGNGNLELNFQGKKGGVGIALSSHKYLGSGLKSWTDKRKHPSAEETILKVEIPILLDSWVAKSQVIYFGDQVIQAELAGSRDGITSIIEVSVYRAPTQLKLEID